MGTTSEELLVELAKEFIGHYFSKPFSEVLRLYHYKALPLGKQVADVLKERNELDKAIDKIAIAGESTAFLMKSEKGYTVFVFRPRD